MNDKKQLHSVFVVVGKNVHAGEVIVAVYGERELAQARVDKLAGDGNPDTRYEVVEHGVRWS